MKNLINELEWQNKKANRYSTTELIEIFPEAKVIIERQLSDSKNQHCLLVAKIQIKLTKLYKGKLDKFSTWFWEQWIEINEGDELKKLSKNIKDMNSALYPPNFTFENGITDRMIEIAEEYPITNLIEPVRNNMAICPFHNDKRPSMNLKNNFAYCHACGYSANTIKLYQDLNHVGFIEAVKKLN